MKHRPAAKKQAASSIRPETAEDPRSRADASRGALGDTQPRARSRAPARLVGALSEIRTRRPVLLLTGLSLLACCLMFAPAEWWPLAHVCLVPWLVCVCTARSSRFVYFVSLLFGVGYFLVNVRWMLPVTPPGYVALCLGYAVSFPLAAWPIRHMHRRYGVSVALTAPVAWVAMEYLRSVGPLGFPLLLLGHTHYKVLTMIQISDLVGAYGVSFVLAMVNGWITDLFIQPILLWRADRATRLPAGSLTTLLVVLGTLIYGSSQRSRRHFKPGPKVAIVQHDFAMYVDPARARRTATETIFDAYLALATQAAAEKPDLIILPETAFSCFLNNEFLEASSAELEEIRRRRYPFRPEGFMKVYQNFSLRVRDAFQSLSDKTGIPMVLGFSALEWKPKAIPPGVEAFNSAFLLKPGAGKAVARYDKTHLVLFGEYVPFRTSYHKLYRWLNSQTPWGRAGSEYSLTAGRDYTVFEFEAASQAGRPYRAAAPICYEECMPYIARAFTRGSDGSTDKKNIDMLLTISNDGWFLHSAELEHHLATGVFRAVENRIAVARSVNTGASAQIHPNGKIHDYVVLTEEKARLLEAVTAALRKLHDAAGKLEAQAGSDKTYLETFEELGQVCLRDLRPAVRAAGPEFVFIDERLGPLMYELRLRDAERRFEALRAFTEQVQDDLDMIARWNQRPQTAPGYIIADLKCDDRVSLYSRWGDWFGRGAVGLVIVMLLDWLRRRLMRRKTSAQPDTEGAPA